MKTEVKTEVKKLVTKSALRILDIETLQVDPSYQRDVKPRHRRIVSDYNANAIGIPLVGEREDGTLWIVDGLQRITALKKLNHAKVRAETFNSHGPEHEAEVFKLVNMNRTKLTAGEEFRALLAAGDALAWSIKEVVEKAGHALRFVKGGNNRKAGSRDVFCFSTMIRFVRLSGVACLEFALKTADECWPNDPLGVHNSMVGGLCTYHARAKGLVDIEKLYPKLKKTTAHAVLYAANLANTGNNLWTTVADHIDKVGKKRLGKPKKEGV